MSNALYTVSNTTTAYAQALDQLVNGLNGSSDIGDITAFPQITSLPGALTAAAGAAGSLSGAYAYVVTYVTGLVDGTGALHTHGETNGGTASTTVNVTSQNIDLTSIPIGPTGTIARKIYRTVAGGSSFLFDFQISDNTTTSWTDTTVDGGLGAAIPTTNTTGSRFVGDSSGLTNLTAQADFATHIGEQVSYQTYVTRDMTLTGTQIISLPFQAKTIQIQSLLAGTSSDKTAYGSGFCDAALNQRASVYIYNVSLTNYTWASSAVIIDLTRDNTNTTQGQITQINSSGFTITWTQTGTGATGTAVLNILASTH